MVRCSGHEADFTHLEQHELVERIVPLHQKDAIEHGTTQVLVAVVGVPSHAALGAALGVRHLCNNILC